jgi:hypothetical protein
VKLENGEAGERAREKQFISFMLVNPNASAAARAIGYSAAAAGSAGYRLLRKPAVAAALEKAREGRAKKLGIRADRVLQELEMLAHSVITDYVLDAKGDVVLATGAHPEAMRAVQSIKKRTRTYGEGAQAVTEYDVEIRLWDKPGSIKLAGRHLGLAGFNDRVEVSGPDGGPIQIQAQALAQIPTERLEQMLAWQREAEARVRAALPERADDSEG